MSGTLTLRFRPEAWINDYAVEVDAEGPTVWNASPAYAEKFAGRDPRSDLDFMQDDPAAPSWVRGWRGPFTIEVVGGTADAE